MAFQDDYQVRLDSFQGPMDLLLFLIRRAEVDIADIPIRQLTEQYFAFLKELHTIDIDVAGEFLVMAATLVEIKSRTLTPASARGPGEGGEGGEFRLVEGRICGGIADLEEGFGVGGFRGEKAALL